MKVNISVVIITYNEEKNILRCINSVTEIADEIIVVDSYSTDKTKEICLQNNVKFFEHKFEGHIEQKNWALTKATNNYILSLDADEAISEQLKKSIISVKNDWKYDGYYFNRLTNYCGKWIKHCGWYPDKKLRLFIRTKAQWKGTNPHDKIKLNNPESKKFLFGDLLHYSYYSISQHIEQVNKFSEIAALSEFNKNKKTNIFKIIFKPFWKFIRDYVFKAGFLDGYYGFVICKISSFATLLKNIKLYELNKAKFK